MVKWISLQSSELSLGVRIPPGAHEKAELCSAFERVPSDATARVARRDSKRSSIFSSPELVEGGENARPVQVL